MNKRVAQATLAAAFCISAVAQAQTATASGYLLDSRGAMVKSGFGLCWRSGYWTPAMASAECDAALVKTDAPAPAVSMPAAAIAAPAAAARAPVAATAAAPAAPKAVTVVLKGRLFDFGKATLKPAAKAQLDQEVVAQAKRMGPLKQLIVAGHSDRLGKAAYNQKLSERRANAVRDYLVSKGVDGKLIDTFGFAATQPAQGVPKCEDRLPRKKLIDCLEPHRRVEIEIQPAAK